MFVYRDNINGLYCVSQEKRYNKILATGTPKEVEKDVEKILQVKFLRSNNFG